MFKCQNLSNIKLDASYKIENSINNKTSWCNIKSDSTYNIKNNSSNNTSKNLDRASIENKNEITIEGNNDKHYSINHLRFCVPKEWRQTIPLKKD